MTGLVLKDFLVMRKTIRAYVGIAALYLVLTALGMFQVSFVTSFLSIMIMVLPISAFAYDEQAKWDRYAMSLPLGRRRVVGARYLFVLVLVLVSSALGMLAGVSLSLFQGEDAVELTATVLATVGVGLFLCDILLPLSYKLGPERARPYLYVLVFLPMVALFGVYKLGLFDHMDLDWVNRLPAAGMLGLFALIPLAALAGLGISFLISCRIVENKEF